MDFDPLSGSPGNIVATSRFLSSAQPNRAGVNDAVRAFINANAGLFGYDASILQQARVTREDVTAHNGMHTTVWQQEVDGIPLYQASLRANVTRDGALVALGSRFLPDAAAATGMDAGQRAALVALPPINVQQAISLAAANLGDLLTPEQVIPNSTTEGPERKQRFSAPLLSDTMAQLSWLPMNATTARLAWDVTVMSLKQNSMFRVLVDAATGHVLERVCLTNDLSNASYRVYADGATLQPFDSPTPMSPGWSTPSSAQPATVSRNLITTQALDTTASPSGWINDGVTATYGNNVDAHLDPTNTNPTYGAGIHATSATRNFDFPLDLALAPAAYQNAAVTQLFYLCNWCHDKMYALGFTETSGNFQQNNFGRGGLSGDAVLADVQDGGGTNNANFNFSVSSDGDPVRMQMYVFTGPTPDRDGDIDAEIVVHEYTHGLSNRLVGGGADFLILLQPQGLGEGWSDFYALCLLSHPEDDVNGNYAIGAYATDHYGELTENYYYGVRRYPYTTDMSRNPLTIKDIDPAKASAHPGIPKNPTSTSLASEVHNMGEVWCAMLWDARANLVNKLGAAAGNQMILQLVTDGMKLTPVNPTYLQARDAIIQADLVNCGGANKHELWAAFAKRGMGAYASVPVNANTTTGVIESFDLPDDLKVSPGTTFASEGPAGGPFSPSSQTYTLSNAGAASISWSASSNQQWLQISPSSRTLAIGANVVVTASLTPAANALAAGSYSATIQFTNTNSGGNVPRAVTLDLSPPRLVLFDLTNDPGWTRQGQWAYGTPTGAAVDKGYPDPTSGATGTKVFGVNLGGNYNTTPSGVPYYLTTGAIDLSNMTSARLRFKRWLNTDWSNYVSATVEVSNNGTDWTNIYQNPAGTPVTDYSWNTLSYDISTVADNHATVFIRWGYQIVASAGAYAYAGWNLDDIEILGASTNQLAVSLSTNSATEGGAPVTGTIHAAPPPVNDLVVHLTSSDTTEATVPATVTVPAGHMTVDFPITIIDDAILDGSQNAIISATAAGFPEASNVIVVNDNETATLSLTLPAAANENAGAVQGRVSLDVPPDSAVVVCLNASDPDAVQTPASVTIPAGHTSADFTMTILDDTRINGTHAATITAHVANWTDATAEIVITDNEVAHLSVSLPAQCAEGATHGGTVSISGTLAADLAVSLVSGNPSRLSVPPTVIIPAGSTSVTFPVAATDNTLTEGVQYVTITASASGFTGAGGGVSVSDNAAHHFSFATISSPQSKGASIDVTITAQDAGNATVTGYAGTPVLTATGSLGAVAISSSSAGGFIDGVWTGSVVILSADTNIVLTATDGIGRTGSSNSFNVIVPVDLFTELFNANRPNDVSNQSFLFTPDGSPGFYAVQRTPANAFPTDPIDGIGMTMQNDNYVQFNLSGGSTVKLYGTSYATYYVGSNGYVTFGSGDSNSSVSLANHFGKPRIAALFDDLFPNTRQVTRKQTADRVAITWQGVPESGINDSNSFQIEMFFDGRIRITCLGIAASDGLIGLSKGLGTPSGFVMSDFSAYPTFSIGVEVPAITTEGDVPVTGTLTVSPAPASNLLVSLSSGDTTEATVPTSVTLLAGQTTTTFPITILDDAVLDGTQNATITASASGYATGAGVIAVRDNETTSITVSVPASTTEGVGTVQGTVTLATAPASAVSVNLTSSDTTEVTVPATLTIAAGQTSANFTISVVDDVLIDGAQPVTITAHVANWTDGSAVIAVQDNETVNLALTLPVSVSESGAGTGIVSISGTLASPLTVALASGNSARLAVPATVTIPAGFTSTTFYFTAPNNMLTDGQQMITLTSGATGFNTASGSIYVTDDDVHHYEVSAIASPQVRGVPFSVTLTAKDCNNVTIANHAGTAGLTASSSGGAVSITPAVTTAFTGGVWTGSVTANGYANNLVITARDGAGHTGASNPFTVGVGALHHFGWSPVPGPRVSGVAFGATLTALDVADNTVTSFTSTASLSGFTGSGSTWTLLNNPSFAKKYSMGTYTLGYSFTPSSNMLVTAVRSFAGTKVSIWTNTGTLLASVPITATPDTWTDTPLASPLQLQAGVVYRLGVLSGGASYYARTDMGTTFPHGTINQSYSSSGNAFPTTVDSNRWWFVDLRYTLGSPVMLSPATTAAFAAGVWSGNLTVSPTGTGVSLYANDSSGHFGQSDLFDVLLTPPSTNANLSGLALSAGTLTPVFASGVTSYTASVANATTSTTLTPTLAESHATVTVNGTSVVSGNASGSISLSVGDNAVATIVTAQDGVTRRTYTLAVTRRTPYQDWAAGLGLGGTALDPAADSDGDGLANLCEWAFATNPASSERNVMRLNGSVLEAHGGPAILDIPNGSGATNHFALFGRRKDAAAVGLTYVVEFSSDLLLWTASSDAPLVVAQDDQIEAVLVPFPTRTGGTPLSCFRIRVTSQ